MSTYTPTPIAFEIILTNTICTIEDCENKIFTMSDSLNMILTEAYYESNPFSEYIKPYRECLHTQEFDITARVSNGMGGVVRQASQSTRYSDTPYDKCVEVACRYYNSQHPELATVTQDQCDAYIKNNSIFNISEW